MKISSLHVGSHLTLNNQNFKIIRKLEGKVYLERLDDLSIVVKKEHSLLEFLTKGNLTLFGRNRKEVTNKNQQPDLISLPEMQRKTVLFRYEFIKAAILKLGKYPTTVNLSTTINEVARHLDSCKKPSLDSVYKWWKKYHESGGNIISLGNKKTGKAGVRRFKQVVIDEIKTIIDEEYLVDTRPTAAYVYRLFEHRIEVLNSLRPTPLKFPSSAQFYRIIKKLNQYEKMVNREGKKKADKHFRSSGAGVPVNMILERVEVDHTPIDALVVDDKTGITLGRPTLTVIIDVYSRMILGFYMGFEPASLVAVMRALRQGIMPKDTAADYLKGVSHEWPAYGIPMTIICDNGSEFHAETFHRLCSELNINIQYCPKLEAHYKGTVERVVGTINSEVCHNLPGSTSSSIKERGDYDPEKFAIVTEKELKNLISKWIVDIYQNRVHTTTKRTPNALWNEGLEAVSPVLPESESALAFCMTHEETRRLTHKGIEIFNMFYNSARSESNYDVVVRADPEDITNIWVFDEENGDYIRVPSTTPDYANGLSLRQHKHIRKNLIDKGLGEQNKKVLNEHIYKLNQDIKELKSSKLQKQRRKAAQLTQESQSVLLHSNNISEAVDNEKSNSLDFEDFEVFEFETEVLESEV